VSRVIRRISTESERLDILREIKRRRPDIEVIVASPNATVHSAVQAMKNGADEYVAKPFSLRELKLLLESVGAHLKHKVENRRFSERIKSDKGFGKIIGRAPEMDTLYRIIGKAAQSAHPVLILGESGTGKEMVAHAIHHSGCRDHRNERRKVLPPIAQPALAGGRGQDPPYGTD